MTEASEGAEAVLTHARDGKLNVPPSVLRQFGSEGINMRHFCVLLFVLAVSSFSVCQYSRADLFAGYSYVNIDTNGLTSRQNANGWEAAVSGNFNKWFAVEGDVSGYYKN